MGTARARDCRFAYHLLRIQQAEQQCAINMNFSEPFWIDLDCRRIRCAAPFRYIPLCVRMRACVFCGLRIVASIREHPVMRFQFDSFRLTCLCLFYA